MKQIVCMKWGDKYDATYVNKLYAMTSRNIGDDFRFVCLTDDTTGINENIECMECPVIAIPQPFCNVGWRKITLWMRTLANMEGDWLFLDLDIVITGSLDAFFEFGPEKSFIVMRNWTQPGQDIGNTSVYRFRVGSHPYLYENLIENHEELTRRFRNSQTYISRTVKEISFWPDEWCILFKTHCVPPMPQRWWKEPALPPNTRVVAFPGSPNPDEAVAGEWPAKWYKKIYKHIRPASWINRYWTV